MFHQNSEASIHSEKGFPAFYIMCNINHDRGKIKIHGPILRLPHQGGGVKGLFVQALNTIGAYFVAGHEGRETRLGEKKG